MIDKLLEFITNFWNELMPFFIINDYEQAIILRGGKFKKQLNSGWYLKYPFYDTVISAIVTKNTFHVANVNVTTLDGKTISVGPIIEYDVADVKKYLLDVNEAISNAHDVARGIIADYLTDCVWEDVKKKTTLTEIKKKLKTEFSLMGINVTKVLFGDISITRVFTLFRE